MQLHRIKADPGGNSSGKVAFNPSMFFLRCFVVPLVATIYQNIFRPTTPLFHCILFILTLGNKLMFCTDIQISSPRISRILTKKALPFFVTLPAPFLVIFSSHGKKLI